ncbi:MAG: RNA 2'-phosphotransferase [bacterium]
MDALPGIDAEGLLPQRRTHVHLAEGLASVVGKRANVAVMLAADPGRLAAHGLGVFRAPNGVLLVRQVPRDCIVGARPMTRAAEAARAGLTATFGVA